MSATFDADLRPVDCAGCRERVVQVDGRCPLCASLAARGRGPARPLVGHPWPRLVVTAGPPLSTPRGARSDLPLCSVVVVTATGGGEAALRIEPRALLDGEAASVVCTALAAGVRVDGVDLAAGASRAVARGASVSVGAREARIL